jgi:PIN domain nuclease of toxin-antitoxin system
LTQKAQKPFSYDQVKMVWKQLAFKMKEKGQENVYFALNKRDPKLFNDIEIHHECDNQIQIEIIQSQMSEILEFIRKELENYSVKIFFSLIENQEENLKLLTGKDKFLALSKKNANLFSLQKTFNLDIDL